MKLIRWIFSKWDFLLAALLAALGSYYLPANAVKDITTELIAFFSIQSAVILPAMIFTAGILKPDGLELDEAARYHKALKSQMLFWVVLLGLDFFAVVSLIVGKAVGWSIVIDLPNYSFSADVGWIIPVVLYFSGLLAILRTIPFVRGVLSLLDLNSDMTQKAISRRNRIEAKDRQARANPAPMSLPDGYGNILERNGDR